MGLKRKVLVKTLAGKGAEVRHVISVSTRTIWTTAGVAIAGALLWTIGAHVVPQLVLLFGAITVAEGMRPLVAWLVVKRVPRPIAILAIVFVALAILGGLGWLILTPLVTQVVALIGDIPHFAAVAEGYLKVYQRFLHDNRQAALLLQQLPGRVSTFLTSKIGIVLQTPLILAGVLSNAFLLLLIVFFWLMASQELAIFVLSFAPAKRRPAVREVLDELSVKIGGYLRGVLINMLVIGLLSGIGVALLGVPYALLLGVVASLTEAIPILGPVLAGSAAVLVALLAFGPGKALQVALLYVAIQQIEGNTLVPFVMNRVVAINPLLIVVALVIGSALLGVPGAILSVPGAAVVQVFIVRVIAPALRATLVHGRERENLSDTGPTTPNPRGVAGDPFPHL